ncbi:unnamed protein product [Arabidopsis thaliana]|uniref:(thale cress) hypothetical protein n=1 Tax=Arabidopsis thaliana TaxID=3702 RepID=A0A7G2EUF1_ARATH|nr:unnamed protein product [Arabidopsis thaliana]
MDNRKERYSKSIRGDRDERDRTKHHHERSHEGSKRKDREEENGTARATNKKSRFEDVARFENRPYTCSIASETTSGQIIVAVKRFQELAHKQTKGFVLRVDALGREIDEHGNKILKPHQLEVDPQENPYFDPRISISKNKILRPKRMSFKEKQSHLKKAEDADMNTNLIELSERVTREEEPIPDFLEWWDAKILTDDTINELSCDPNILIMETITENHLNMKVFNCHIEHPFPIEPPAEAASPPPQPLKMTKEERKKLRTLRRVAKEMEKREMISQGRVEPQKSKVKMSNLMKVRASEATQNPTKLEKEIRTEAAEREQAHMDRNVARKLTPAEKREKKERKLFGDPTTVVETIVSVYKINKKLSDPKTRFKVRMNAKQNILTGCSVMMDGMSIVVVEGKRKAIERYKKLMLKRINWEEAEKKEDEEENGGNKCCLVWQGSVEKPSFHRFHVQECLTKSDAKKVFNDAGVAHYWDLALNYSDD